MNFEMPLKSLCIYRDEGDRASPVPLTIAGDKVLVKKNSDYFAGQGIQIELLLNSQNEILRIHLGSDICVDLTTLKAGLEIGPLGLLPAHVIQMDQHFDPRTGGSLRFGFLKRVFSLESLMFCGARLLSKSFHLKTRYVSKFGHDLSRIYTKCFGEKNWGTYVINVKKDESGKWAVYRSSSGNQEELVRILIARLNINKAGVTLGIQEMYSQ